MGGWGLTIWATMAPSSDPTTQKTTFPSSLCPLQQLPEVRGYSGQSLMLSSLFADLISAGDSGGAAAPVLPSQPYSRPTWLLVSVLTEAVAQNGELIPFQGWKQGARRSGYAQAQPTLSLLLPGLRKSLPSIWGVHPGDQLGGTTGGSKLFNFPKISCELLADLGPEPRPHSQASAYSWILPRLQ